MANLAPRSLKKTSERTKTVQPGGQQSNQLKHAINILKAKGSRVFGW